jgi:ABC-type branched-subunit amino acid transport system ATPase component
MSAAVACQGLESGYGDTAVLRDIGIEIAQGEIYALVGKNGAGKSTFLKTLIGLIAPSRGRIALLDRDVGGWPTHRIIASGVTYAPQDNAFFSELSVDENLRLGSLALTDRRFRTARDRVVAMFPFIGKRLGQKAGTLSGGEQAMVKVARALLPEPKLVLLDEVSEGLQPLAVDRVRQALAQEHAERGVSMLVVEQNLDFVTGFATRYGLIDRGQITGEGSFAEPDAAIRIDRHLSI